MPQDLMYSIRALMKRPGFTLLAVLTVALGIAVSTAMFTIVNGVLWKPFPYPNAERLVRLNEDSLSGGLNNSAPNAADWKARSNVLEDVALYRFFPVVTLRLPDRDQSVVAAYTHANLFHVLGTQPAVGRAFTEAEDRPGAQPVAVITNAAWEKYFGKNPSIVGRAVRVANGMADSLVIVGVMPPGFDYDTVEFWLPLGRFPMPPDTMRGNHWFAGVGRLNPGVSMPRARNELVAISAALEKEYPESNKGVRAVVQSMSDYYAGRVKTPLMILFWAVALVMLIACGNVVHLVLTRTLSRGREMAVRLALGANRLRLVRLLLSEGLMLSVAGGLFGVLAAQWVVTGAIAWQPGLLPGTRKVALDSQAVLYAVAATLFTALLLAVIPVWRVSRTSVLDALKAAGRGSGDGRRQRLGWMMIAGEIAMASVLLAGAGLTIQALRNLSRVDVGYDPNGLLSLSFVPPAGKQYTDESANALLNHVEDAARSVPGYQSAALAQPFSVGGNGALGPVVIPGRTNPSTPPLVPAMSVTPEFFQTMRIPLRMGRTLSRVQGKFPEVVVNEEFVRRFLPGENPLGRRVSVRVDSGGDRGGGGQLQAARRFAGGEARSLFVRGERRVGSDVAGAGAGQAGECGRGAAQEGEERGAGVARVDGAHHGQPRSGADGGGTIHTRPAASIRAVGDAAGVSGGLRGCIVQRGAENPRDRDPDGAGSVPLECGAVGLPGYAAGGAGGHGRRHRGRGGTVPPRAQPVVQCEPGRSGPARRGVAHVAGGHGGGIAGAAAPRVDSGSRNLAAAGMKTKGGRAAVGLAVVQELYGK